MGLRVVGHGFLSVPATTHFNQLHKYVTGIGQSHMNSGAVYSGTSLKGHFA